MTGYPVIRPRRLRRTPALRRLVAEAPGFRSAEQTVKQGEPGSTLAVDFALSAPVPWTNPDVRRSGTVHLAGTLEETLAGEAAPAAGRLTDKPYVLAVQAESPYKSVADLIRAAKAQPGKLTYGSFGIGSGPNNTALPNAFTPRS